MAEIVNLRRARKRRARAEKESAAAASRGKHGRSKAERQAERVRAELAERALEGYRLSPSGLTRESRGHERCGSDLDSRVGLRPPENDD